MAIEIEKKYRLTPHLREQVLSNLQKLGAVPQGEEFEENTLYAGGMIDQKNSILRLRRAAGRAILTYKERIPSDSAVKRRREEETLVEDAEATAAILEALGFCPALVYEKRRDTWHIADAEVAIDELPFGLFVEIEGSEASIAFLERALALTDAATETYPMLTLKHGKPRAGKIEARFTFTD